MLALIDVTSGVVVEKNILNQKNDIRGLDLYGRTFESFLIYPNQIFRSKFVL
jgi:hypothetical protein